MSGMFRDIHLNWAALTKEIYTMYMSVKKLTFYLEDVYITLRSIHLAVQRFLERNTLNSKVNNWTMEIEQYQVKMKYIEGI